MNHSALNRQTFELSVADLPIAIEAPYPALWFDEDEPYGNFLAKHSSAEPFFAHMSIDDSSRPPSLPQDNPHFDSRSLWALWREPDQSWLLGPSPSKKAAKFSGMPKIRVSADWQHSEVFLSDALKEAHARTGLDQYSFGYPSADLLFLSRFAQGYGILMHGALVTWGGKGFLLLGDSGAGKSTLSALLEAHPSAQARILSDDRTAIRAHESAGIRAYGTPWHGTFARALPEATTLEAMIFLSHAAENSLALLNEKSLFPHLLKTVFPPVWDEAGRDFCYEFAGKLPGTVACFQFHFKPDSSACDLLLEHFGH